VSTLTLDVAWLKSSFHDNSLKDRKLVFKMKTMFVTLISEAQSKALKKRENSSDFGPLCQSRNWGDFRVGW